MLHIFFILILFVYNIPTSKQIGNKIIEGDEVPIEEFPYVVSIRYSDNHVCGGAILDERTVLTSAQCVFDMPLKRFITIRVGSSEHANGHQMKVSNVLWFGANTIHEYKREYHENDIGIVKLTSSLTWSDTVKPIHLPDKDYVLSNDTTATFVGWGVTTSNAIEVSATLRKSKATTISYMDCTMQYGSNMIYPGMMLCAQATEREFCRGDLGAPLVVDDKLIGVASWIYYCDESILPGVYTNVVKFLDWIRNNMVKK